MKKTVYIALAAVGVLLAGCTKHLTEPEPEVPDQLRSYIFFEPKVSEPAATKTTILEGESLPTGASFGVLGYHGTTAKTGLFTNEITKVYQPAEGEDFKYDGNLASWKDGNDHYFYAFYIMGQEYATGANAVTANNGDPYISYTQPTTLNEMYDILTAYTATKKVALVPLVFEHRLWALDVKIANNQEDVSYETEGNSISVATSALTITGVEMTVKDLPATAKIPLNSTNTITSEGSNEVIYNLFLGKTSETVEAEKTLDVGTLLFLPCESFSYKLKITYTYNNGEYSGEFTYPSGSDEYASATGLKAGERYSLTVKRTNDKFFVGIGPVDWTTQDIDHTFN